MYRYALLAVLASPALAHPVPYSNQNYLEITNGDAKAAAELENYCANTGRNASQCALEFGGSGNLKAEAARKCAREAEERGRPSFADPGKAHKTEGKKWHTDYHSGGDTGRSHRHYFTDTDRQLAYEAKKRELYKDYDVSTKNLRPEITKTSEGTVGGKGSVGIPGVGSAEMTGGGKNLTEVAQPILTEKDRREIEAAAEAARKRPSLSKIEPSGLCFEGEKVCDDGDDILIENKSYSEEVKKKEDKAYKETGKKTSEASANHGEETPVETNEALAETEENPDSHLTGTSTTPIIEPTSLPAKLWENCMNRETQHLEKQLGAMTKDPESNSAKAEQARAEYLLKSGYCDESYYGVDKCAAYEFKQDSVVAIGVKEEKKQQYKAAMDKYVKTGQCDHVALGMDYCEKALKKYTVTPTEDSLHGKPGKPSFYPSLVIEAVQPITSIPKPATPGTAATGLAPKPVHPKL